MMYVYRTGLGGKGIWKFTQLSLAIQLNVLTYLFGFGVFSVTRKTKHWSRFNESGKNKLAHLL
jgi:hypothetical protein